ncbi:MAG: hypothetical protein PHH26_00075 [Candidatus Thermoplasmatota archaeon]|nr:hypothetical protein [Candidatus Thermoplasmatota archaeon]
MEFAHLAFASLLVALLPIIAPLAAAMPSTLKPGATHLAVAGDNFLQTERKVRI